MAAFEKLYTASILTNKERSEKIEIVKFRKTGTKREFFAPMFGEKRIGSTLFARKYDAERIGRNYLNRIK